MDTAPTAARRALLAGSTGLIGRALLPLLLEGQRYREVHALLRRPVAGLPNDPRLSTQQVDFNALPALPPIDDVFIALGTTIKVAGSQAAFRQVDFDAVVNTARAAKAAGATRLAVVSALGASTSSRVFYNQVKGEMEQAIGQLGYTVLVITQPSLLIGDRAALGQPVRAGEVWAARLLRPVMALVPAGIRPIEARTVARAMAETLASAGPGKQLLSSADMQRFPRLQRSG